MAKKLDWIRIVSWYVMLLAVLTVAGSILVAVGGNLQGLGGLLWAAVLGIIGYGVGRRGERDRVALIAVLWLYMLLSLFYAGMGFYRHLQDGSPEALNRIVIGLLWAVLNGWPLLILHRRSIRSQFTEAN